MAVNSHKAEPGGSRSILFEDSVPSAAMNAPAAKGVEVIEEGGSRHHVRAEAEQEAELI